MGTAALPSFSEQVAKGNYDDLKRTISFSMRLILFITVPAMIAIIALREPIISVLFQRGQFNATSTILTAQALFFYAVGLWAFSVIRVVVSAFYALQDAKSPMKAAIVALIVNLAVSVAFMFPLQHGGLALATSVASAVNLIMLAVILKKRIGNYLDPVFYSSLGKIVFSSLVMWGVIALIDYFMPWNVAAPFRDRLVFLSACVVIGMAVFFMMSYLLKSPEIVSLTASLKRRLKGR